MTSSGALTIMSGHSDHYGSAGDFAGLCAICRDHFIQPDHCVAIVQAQLTDNCNKVARINPMSDRKTEKFDPAPAPQSPLIFVHATGTQGAAPAWVDKLVQLGHPVYSHRALPGCVLTENRLEQAGQLLEELSAQAPGRIVILLHAGLEISNAIINDLAQSLADQSIPLARTILSNAQPELNPFAGLVAKNKPLPGQIGAFVAVAGQGVEYAIDTWPQHLVALSASAVAALAGQEIRKNDLLARLHAAGGSIRVSDRHFAFAAYASLFNDVRLEAHESARPSPWGMLASRLQDWLDSGCPAVAPVGVDGAPVTLHITHSWGGGVAQWIRTFIDTDSTCHHLQLRSEGPQGNSGFGQKLALYAGDELSVPIQQWWMQPAIASIDCSNDQYRQILDWVCRRYGVGRVVVSSLVGHSLDALRSGVPTLQVLHDHFPVWPFLSENPHRYPDVTGRPDIATALACRTLHNEFPDQTAESWAKIRDEYLAAVTAHQVKLVAPGQSVVELQKALDARWTSVDINVIPHGFPALHGASPVQPRARHDRRLRVVILGRMQAGKGQQLLLQALQGIRPYAQVYLLGAGKSGEAFFGLPGVDVILNFERNSLARLMEQIGPDVAALLSVVPETFSYTLSELQHLAIPVIATRSGSFADRIRHGETGWLIAPDAAALEQQIASLFKDRAQIGQVRKNLQQPALHTPLEMTSAYQQLLPCRAPGQAWQDQPASHAQAQAAAQAFLLNRQATRARLADTASKALRKETEKRTAWALETERRLQEEQQRNTRWVKQLEATIDEANHQLGRSRAELTGTRAELAETRSALEQSDAQLVQVRQDLDQLQQVHDQVLASSSWKLTRPFRVLRRAAGNFMISRAWNPLRWPLLLSALVRNLATVGIRGTLMRIQYSGYHALPAPAGLETIEEVGDPVPPEALPVSPAPQVSIVIPVFNKWVYTAACLRSIADAQCASRFEVIVVDDQSTDQTAEQLAGVKGLKVLRNPENAGFIDSCNRGAAAARGKYLVLLNNDTQVTDGWLDRLLDTFRAFPDAGLVGSRLIYPDGKLQECGGLIFSDGSGWNFGRGAVAESPEYKYVRKVDYCSGACIMVETELFNGCGGFDVRYRPAYYEDTDLAFRVRASGRKVLVQPASTVIHHEGITSGTDTGSGIKRYQQINAQKFLERWSGELQNFPPRIEDPTNPARIRAARDHHLRGRVLIIDATTPEPDQDSGSLRLSNIMRCFLDLGFGVTFFAENHAHAGRYTQNLQQMGVEVLYEPWLESNHNFFRQRGAEFSHVFISRHYVAANFITQVRKNCPQAKLIFDTVDLHYLREQRLAELENSLPLKRVASQTRRSELAVIEESDAVLVVSPAEVEVLSEDAPDALVHILTNIHDVPGRRCGYAERRDLFFVGGYQHPPNVDAAVWFVTRIWPLIHAELPEAQFHLIGSKAPDKIRSLKGDGVIFHGFVEDLEHYLDHCRLAVAPLRYGAGVKGKVNMSMSHGQPVVATPVAIEGLHAEHDRDVLVAETEQTFAGQVVRLYRDEALWNRISDAAIANVEAHFSIQAAQRSLEDLLELLK